MMFDWKALLVVVLIGAVIGLLVGLCIFALSWQALLFAVGGAMILPCALVLAFFIMWVASGSH